MDTQAMKHANEMDTEKLMKNFQQACAKAGLKMTHQRLEIYRILVESTDHPTAESLHSRLKQSMPTLSLDTVYRTLATLEQFNLIKRVQTVHAQCRYEARLLVHHHFICRNCNTVYDFIWNDFDSRPLPEQLTTFGDVLDTTVTVTGICKSCQTKEETPQES